MTHAELSELKKLLLDLRFIQAAALVGAELTDNKAATAYMRRIRAAEKAIERELEAV